MSHKEDGSNFKLQTWTIVMGGLMAIITGVLSAFLTDHLAQRAWLTNADYQQRVAVFQKRLDLIERTSQLAGRAPGLDDVWQRYLQEINTSVKKDGLPTHDPALSEKLGEYNGQFRATLEMDALFFGPRTRAAIDSLKPSGGPLPYWNYPSENVGRLLSAMAGELQAPPVSPSTDGKAK